MNPFSLVNPPQIEDNKAETSLVDQDAHQAE
jgi:hypothetical protein